MLSKLKRKSFGGSPGSPPTEKRRRLLSAAKERFTNGAGTACDLSLPKSQDADETQFLGDLQVQHPTLSKAIGEPAT